MQLSSSSKDKKWMESGGEWHGERTGVHGLDYNGMRSTEEEEDAEANTVLHITISRDCGEEIGMYAFFTFYIC